MRKLYIMLATLTVFSVLLSSCSKDKIREEEVEYINREMCAYLNSNGAMSPKNFNTLKTHLSRETLVTVNVVEGSELDIIKVKHAVAQWDIDTNQFKTKIYYVSMRGTVEFCNYEMDIFSDEDGKIIYFTSLFRGYC